MGVQGSTMGSLRILKVEKDSISHRYNILPFIHSIIGFNGKEIQSKGDAEVLNEEWRSGVLKLDFIDMRNEKAFSIEIPRKDKTMLGVGIKFYDRLVPPLSMHILSMAPDSPGFKSGMVEDDYILGVENLSFDDEDELLDYLSLNRDKIVPLLVYNHELGYVRRVDLHVGSLTLLGCEVGTGQLHRVPYKEDWGRMEYDAARIGKDVEEIRRRQEGMREGEGDQANADESPITIPRPTISRVEEADVSGDALSYVSLVEGDGMNAVEHNMDEDLVVEEASDSAKREGSTKSISDGSDVSVPSFSESPFGVEEELWKPDLPPKEEKDISSIFHQDEQEESLDFESSFTALESKGESEGKGWLGLPVTEGKERMLSNSRSVAGQPGTINESKEAPGQGPLDASAHGVLVDKNEELIAELERGSDLGRKKGLEALKGSDHSLSDRADSESADAELATSSDPGSN
jgi:hypothetical protein